MNKIEKLAVFERIRQIVADQITLEKHFDDLKRGPDAQDFTRLGAYDQILKIFTGPGAVSSHDPRRRRAVTAPTTTR
jgi:hypothetical protein